MMLKDFLFENGLSILLMVAFPFIIHKAYKTIMNYDAEKFRQTMQK